MAQQRAHVVHLPVHRGRVAATAVDLLHDDAGRGQAQPGAAPGLRHHRRQPAGRHQRVDELLGIRLAFVDPAEVFVGELAAQGPHRVADVLVVVSFVQHRAMFLRPGAAEGRGCGPASAASTANDAQVPARVGNDSVRPAAARPPPRPASPRPVT
jgi:hypothetical protein